ncbi:DEAD/DEAH box helicase [Virgibacillus sp. Bac332]|uniref:DEAD/DEAH box helicase n=2 Tax=unclassified Virgibacillus TaxID=2620237 RepID=UPI000EF54D15|nr:DEAD/DEAH box helicase [Virgibacillus sp. Bac332]
MKPDNKSQQLLGVTRSKAKMYEYGVPTEYHIQISKDPARLFNLSIGILGDLAAQINSESVDENKINQLHKNLQFSARFFDSYLQSRLKKELTPYLLMLGSASYYLCDLPGSSIVLAGQLGDECPDLDAEGLEKLLFWLLQGDYSKKMREVEGPYVKIVDEMYNQMNDYYNSGKGQDVLIENALYIRKIAYGNGTPRQLLFADIICAVIKKRILNSVWYCLPQYTGIPINRWEEILYKSRSIREFWPAQHLLGKHGIFRGESGIVQMPTSAGKTKATEFIIRSAFLSDRTSLTVVVAPFRALCNEISNSLKDTFRNEPVNIDELSDVMQTDFEIDEFLQRKQVLIVTPEKLLYVLRQFPELAEGIGLIIYDEGHQFDSGSRGITYELLLTSVKSMISRPIQTVLISAVIRNAESVGNWLNGEGNEIVSGTNLIPTYRTVAFASWLDQRGKLEFVEPSNPENGEFFVPRIIERYQLNLKNRERRERFFPERTDAQTIALYFGIKLILNGSIAIFCGTKSSVSSMCEKIVDAYDRGLALSKPIEYSNFEEIRRLHFLYQCNLGDSAATTKSAELGILTHHGNTPHGIRLSVEHAMKEGMASFVICTSTLAQGVNLPIRYLIVTSLYQGSNRIKVRDFHNLIGRTGRSGIHTEGSVIFADPNIYDQRRGFRTRWKWGQVKELLEPANSEPCASTLLQVFEPLKSDTQGYTIEIDMLDVIQDYLNDPKAIDEILENFAIKHNEKGFTKKGLIEQMSYKMNIISSVESYLMTHEDDFGFGDEEVAELAKGTLAYFLASDEEQTNIVELFKLLTQHIVKNVPDISKRKIFGKTLYGVQTSINIEKWLSENIKTITTSNNSSDLLIALWSILSKNIHNNIFKKCDKPDVIKEIAIGWIEGKPFYELYDLAENSDMRLVSGTQRRHVKIDHIVEVCENAFAYDGTLIIGAIIELLDLTSIEETEDVINELKLLQKKMKYGLSSLKEIMLYESGFSDRVVSKDLSSLFNKDIQRKQKIRRDIKQKKENVRELLKKYPSYFTTVFENIIK